jgi:hypothetical protein
VSLRADLVALVDDVRHDVIDEAAGLRLHDVVVRRTTWSGGAPGRGSPSHDDLALTPRPRVRADRRYGGAEGGRLVEGAIIVDRISATLTAAALGAGPLAASVEVIWLIDGAPYRPSGPPEARLLEWRQTLVPVARRPGA